MQFPLLSVIIFIPLVAGLAILLFPAGRREWIRYTALGAASLTLLLSFILYLSYDSSQAGYQFLEEMPWVPALGISYHMGVDGISVPLVLLAGIVVFCGVLISWNVEERPREFFAFLLFLATSVLGVFCSLDLFQLFFFFELAVFPKYLMIINWGYPKTREYGAMKLTLYLLAGTALVVPAALAVYWAAGLNTFDLVRLTSVTYGHTFQVVVYPFLFIGFGILAGMWPLHTWSPVGHVAAPTAVSMLHAGVLMKLGAFGVLRIGMVLVPDAAAWWAPIVGAVAVVNVLYGALCAASQKDLKYIVAYSSVSHMGVVMLGIATMNAAGWNGAVYQMVAHGIMTGLFFALVGLVYERAHTRAIRKMGGFGRVMPGVAAFFTLACLSSLGLPGTAGFVSEFVVFLGAWKSGHYLWTVAGVLGAFVTAIYVLRATRSIFWGPGPTDDFHELTDARRTEWGSLVLLGTGLVVLGVWPRLLMDMIDIGSSRYLPMVLAMGGPS